MSKNKLPLSSDRFRKEFKLAIQGLAACRLEQA